MESAASDAADGQADMRKAPGRAHAVVLLNDDVYGASLVNFLDEHGAKWVRSGARGTERVLCFSPLLAVAGCR